MKNLNWSLYLPSIKEKHVSDVNGNYSHPHPIPTFFFRPAPSLYVLAPSSLHPHNDPVPTIPMFPGPETRAIELGFKNLISALFAKEISHCIVVINFRLHFRNYTCSFLIAVLFC